MFKKLFGNKNDEHKFVTPAPTKDTCPYCGFRFEKIPTRKKKCPECENYIFVRWGNLYTEEEKEIKDWLDHYNAKQLGVSREKFNKTRQELSQEFGFIASVNDTLWRILNHIVAQDKSYTHKKIAYQAMESILKLEGKNTDDVVAQARKMELMEGKIANEEKAKAIIEEILKIQNLGIEMLVVTHTANDEYVCDECRNLNQKTFTIDEFLEDMPIPHKCTNVSCRCGIGFTSSDFD